MHARQSACTRVRIHAIASECMQSRQRVSMIEGANAISHREVPAGGKRMRRRLRSPLEDVTVTAAFPRMPQLRSYGLPLRNYGFNEALSSSPLTLPSQGNRHIRPPSRCRPRPCLDHSDLDTRPPSITMALTPLHASRNIALAFACVASAASSIGTALWLT